MIQGCNLSNSVRILWFLYSVPLRFHHTQWSLCMHPQKQHSIVWVGRPCRVNNLNTHSSMMMIMWTRLSAWTQSNNQQHSHLERRDSPSSSSSLILELSKVCDVLGAGFLSSFCRDENEMQLTCVHRLISQPASQPPSSNSEPSQCSVGSALRVIYLNHYFSPQFSTEQSRKVEESEATRWRKGSFEW